MEARTGIILRSGRRYHFTVLYPLSRFPGDMKNFCSHRYQMRRGSADLPEVPHCEESKFILSYTDQKPHNS